MKTTYHSLAIPLILTCTLSACVVSGTHPDDPYEPINRQIHRFNTAFDATLLKPPAIAYKTIVPIRVRAGINNMYNNVNLLPTVANDILQWSWQDALRDTWRCIINTSIGIGGIFDPASTFGLPPHSNDLGLTFAKWGDKHSPYIVIPFLGPSTIRDGMGMMFDYTFFTPYPYIQTSPVLYGILGVRYVDLRSQMLETDHFIAEAIDPYTFIRDAYLQHRNYLITGEQADNSASLYVEEETEDTVLPETPANGSPSAFPLTTAMGPTQPLNVVKHLR